MKAKKKVNKAKNRAFPSSILKDKNGQEYVSMGMELRDYFAGQAIIGILPGKDVHCEVHRSASAAISYKVADAMMKQRNIKQ